MNDFEEAAREALEWARIVIRSGRWKFDPEDLESMANEAIAKGLNSYNPDAGASLKTWVMSRIKWGVIDGMRSDSKVGSRRAAGRFLHLSIVNREAPAGGSSFEGMTFIDDAGLSYTPEIERDSEPDDELQYVLSRIDCPRRRLMIRLRAEGKSFKRISRLMGVSDGAISQTYPRLRHHGNREKECAACGISKTYPEFGGYAGYGSGLHEACSSCERKESRHLIGIEAPLIKT